MDHCFWTPEDCEEKINAILVDYDSEQLGLCTMTVYAKGPTTAAVECLSRKIYDAGYNGFDITMKADQEESINSRKKAASAKRKAATVMIDSPVRVSLRQMKILSEQSEPSSLSAAHCGASWKTGSMKGYPKDLPS